MIGKTVSHYKILEELGRGGMGVVYKAFDTDLERTVAIKFLLYHISSGGETSERFMNEAKTASALDHQHIGTIYEIGHTEEGQTFIVMAYYDGETLRELIDRGSINTKEALEISGQVTEALSQAHAKNIIHRDIKPSNVIITGEGQAKLVDFGLAKLAGKTRLTHDGSKLGTAAYMSPEQALGKAVDHRSDIWSMGVVLYEMLTGRLPFKGEHEQAIIYSILNTDPEPVTQLRKGTPIELEQIIIKCLAKDAGERYQSADDLSAELHHLNKPALQRTETSRTTVPRRPSRKRFNWFVGVSAAVILAVLIFQVASRFFPGLREAPNRSAANNRTRLVVLSFENLGPPEDEYFADGITEEITSRLAAIRQLGVISRKSALHYKDSNKTISEIGAELDVDYVLEGTVRWEQSPGGGSRVRVTPQLIRVSDDSHIWAEQYDEKFEAIFEIQSRIAEQVAAQMDIALTGGEQDFLQSKPTGNTVAYEIYLRAADHLVFGHRPEAGYHRVEELLKQAIGIDPGFALAHAKLSHVYRSLYFYGYERTDERLQMAKEEIDKALELDPEASEVQRELGYYYYQGLLDYDRALEVFTSLATKLPNDAALLQDIAYIWRRQGHLEQALANLESAYSMNPMDAGLCVEISHTNLGLRRPEEALDFVNKAIAIAPESHWGYFIKSGVYIFGMGDLEKAWEASEACPKKDDMNMLWGRYYLHLLGRDYQMILDLFDGYPFDVIRMQSAYLPVSMLKGHACKFMGDEARAHVYYEEALDLLERAVRENPEDPRIYSAMGSTYAGLGRKAEAIAAGRKAVEIYPITRDAILGVDRMMDLATIYARVGEEKAAIELIREFLTIPAVYTIKVIELDPRFDAIRTLPAYQQLVREFGSE